MIQELQSDMQSRFANFSLQWRSILSDELEHHLAQLNGLNGHRTSRSSRRSSHSSRSSRGAFEAPNAVPALELSELPEVPEELGWEGRTLTPSWDEVEAAEVEDEVEAHGAHGERKVMFHSKTVDLRHSLLHSIAELETQSRAPLNRKLRCGVLK